MLRRGGANTVHLTAGITNFGNLRLCYYQLGANTFVTPYLCRPLGRPGSGEGRSMVAVACQGVRCKRVHTSSYERDSTVFVSASAKSGIAEPFCTRCVFRVSFSCFSLRCSRSVCWLLFYFTMVSVIYTTRCV